MPLETNWRRLQINLLDDSVAYRWRERSDFFAGGNMFIYYNFSGDVLPLHLCYIESVEQLAAERKSL